MPADRDSLDSERRLRLTEALEESDLLGCGCCAGSYDYDKHESRTEAVAAFVLEYLDREQHLWPHPAPEHEERQ